MFQDTFQDEIKKTSLQHLQKHLISAKSPRAPLNSEKPVFPQVSPNTYVSDCEGARSDDVNDWTFPYMAFTF